MKTGKSPQELKQMYLTRVKQYVFYGCTYYLVEQTRKPQRAWLFMNANGIFLTEENSQVISNKKNHTD